MTAPTTSTTTTLREVREVAHRQTPGAVLRRHLFWRYSLHYTVRSTSIGDRAPRVTKARHVAVRDARL